MLQIEILMQAEKKAAYLFEEVHRRKTVVPGRTEKEINNMIFDLAFELYGIRKYWHKRIVRSGSNTLLPYRENPPNLTLQENDILFFDFGPVFEEFEADYGRTYVLGTDPYKWKLKEDIEKAWNIGKQYVDENFNTITGSELYEFTKDLAGKFGWHYQVEHCGHLIGNFPHEKIQGEERRNYLCSDNLDRLCQPDSKGAKRYWIYEIHFIDPVKQIGGFFEQVVSPC